MQTDSVSLVSRFTKLQQWRVCEFSIHSTIFLLRRILMWFIFDFPTHWKNTLWRKSPTRGESLESWKNPKRSSPKSINQSRTTLKRHGEGRRGALQLSAKSWCHDDWENFNFFLFQRRDVARLKTFLVWTSTLSTSNHGETFIDHSKKSVLLASNWAMDFSIGEKFEIVYSSKLNNILHLSRRHNDYLIMFNWVWWISLFDS